MFLSLLNLSANLQPIPVINCTYITKIQANAVLKLLGFVFISYCNKYLIFFSFNLKKNKL